MTSEDNSLLIRMAGVVALIALFVVVAVTLMLERSLPPAPTTSPKRAQSSRPAPPPTTAPAPPPLAEPDPITGLRVGEIMYLVNTHGLLPRIARKGGALVLPNWTRVKVIDSRQGELNSVRVEVLDGEDRGERGMAHPNALRH